MREEAEAATTNPAFERTYLPMDCPTCGRTRLLAQIVVDGGRAFVASVECEKCGRKWPEDKDGES